MQPHVDGRCAQPARGTTDWLHELEEKLEFAEFAAHYIVHS